jgi:polyisoprenoid-binding protein YceI
MKLTSKLTTLALAGLFSLVSTVALAKKFELDPNHSYLAFTASTVIFDVEGRFTRYKVQAAGDPETGAEGQIRVEIDTKSIETGNKTRDKHLQSDDFFAVAKYPKITFTSKKITKDGNRLLVEGTLDLHGVQKELKVPFTISSGVNGAGVKEYAYKAEIPISRKDFGIGADSVAAKISLKDSVTLRILVAGFPES